MTTTTCDTHSRAWGACVRDADHLDDHSDGIGHDWHNYGPVDVFEITWMSGHIETVVAHQVSYPDAGLAALSLGSSIGTVVEPGAPRIRMHAEVNGRWTLTLAALEEDIRTMRLVTDGERLPGRAS